MNQPVDPLAPAIGACLNCRSLFLVTPGSANCLTCGRPPDLTLPFGIPEIVAQALGLEIHVPPEGATPDAPPEPIETPEEEAVAAEEVPLGLLPEGEVERQSFGAAVWAHLVGDDVTSEDLLYRLNLLGADSAQAASAVSHLRAVRELIAQLASAQPVTSAVLSEPEPPPAEPALVAPGADAPPAQEDADRTNPDSP